MATLKEFATANRDYHGIAKTQAEVSLRAAQQTLAAAGEQLALHLKELAQLDEEIADKRAALAVTTVPADVGALNEQIKGKIVLRRRRFAAVLADRDAVDRTGAEAAAAQAVLDRASLALAKAEEELADAEERADDWTRLKTAAAQPPLSQLQAAATAAQTGILAAAKARVDVLTAELVAAVDRGYGRETGRVGLARAAVTGTELALGTAHAGGGMLGQLEQARILFWQAERALRTHVQTAASRFDFAIKLLEGVKADSLLTQSQATAFGDPALATNRKGAATAKDERDDALAKLDVEEAALAAAVLTVRAEDPIAPYDSVPAVQQARGERDAKKTALDTKQTALDGGRPTLDAWLVIAPDPAWTKVRAFQDAEEILGNLAQTNPGTLVTAFNTAEQALAGSLDSVARRARKISFLENQLALREQVVKSAESAVEARTLSAVRGDN